MCSGTARYTAAGRSVSASLNALRNISGIAAVVGTPSDQRVIGANIDTRSTYWWDSLYSRSCPTWAEIATSGVLLVVASATPSCMLMAPGPSVADTTAGRPVTRPYISAMNAAACSWRVSTYLICDDPASAWTKWMFSSPGMPKTRETPSASRQLTISCAAVLIVVLRLRRPGAPGCRHGGTPGYRTAGEGLRRRERLGATRTPPHQAAMHGRARVVGDRRRQRQEVSVHARLPELQ